MQSAEGLAVFVKSCHDSQVSYREAVDEFRRVWLAQTLKKNGNNQCMAAEELGVHRNTLHRMLKSLHFEIDRGHRKKVRIGHSV